LSQRIAFTSALLVLITVVTAATGYLREVVLARTFGTGAVMDAFYFTWGLIQAIHDLLFGAILTATVVPLLHRRDGDEKVTSLDPPRFAVTVIVTVGLLAIIVAAALRGLLPYLLDVLVPKMSDEVRAQSIAISTILVWLLPLNALTNVCVFLLNAYQRFMLAGSVYIFFNVSFVIILLLAPNSGADSVAIAAVAGPAVALPILGFALVRIGLLRPRMPHFNKEFFAPVWRQSKPILLTGGIGSSLGLLMVAHLIIRIFAAGNGEGAIAALGYAFRLYEVPLSLIANPAAVIMLPNIAILYKSGKTKEIGSVVREALLAGLVLLFAAAAVTWIESNLIVHLLLQRGNFGPEATRLTADALRGFSPAIVGEGIIVVFYRVFYAAHQPGITVFASGVALLVIAISLYLFGHSAFIAVPLSLSGGMCAGALAIIFGIKRNFGRDSMPSAAAVAKLAGCGLIALSACWGAGAQFDGGCVWNAVLTGSIFAVIYGAAVLTVFAQYREFLSSLIYRIAHRLRRFVGLAV
jgi:putative peptidoglycan lipid II flippase